MKVGDKGYVIRSSESSFVFIEPALVSLYWFDTGRTVVQYEDGRLLPLEEGEFFLPKVNQFSGVEVSCEGGGDH